MTDLLLRLLYGAIVIASGFLIGSMTRLALREMQKIGLKAGVRSIYFWLAANLAMSSFALVLICGVRTYNSFHGDVAGETWGWGLVIGFALLLLSKVGFTWAGTLGMKHGRAIWWSLIATLTFWTAFVFWLPIP